MDSSLVKCWSSCFLPCLGAGSTKRKCLCRLRRHRNRIGSSQPSTSVPVSSKNSSPSSENGPSFINSEPTHVKLNGETNLYFKEDEVIFSSDIITNDGEVIPTNNHHSSSTNGDCGKDDYAIDSETHESNFTKGFYEFLSTVFLQLSTSKRLRVIHIRKKMMEESSVQNFEDDEIDGIHESESSEDDDEYWFSKWSRRPKLKNTFTPTQKNRLSSIKPLKELTIGLNSRSTFTYEEIQDPLGQQVTDKYTKEQNRIKVSSSNGSSNFDENVSPPTSPSQFVIPNRKSSEPKIHNESAPSEKNSERRRSSLPSDGSNYDFFYGDIQLDLVSKDETTANEISPSAFTNFAFQLEPEDSAIGANEHQLLQLNETNNAKLQEENHKTDIMRNSLQQEDNQIETCTSTTLSHSPLTHNGPNKSNGFIQSDLSTETLDSRRNSDDVDREDPVDNSKPLLFFIHGISGSSDIWKSQFKFFHELGYEIVAPDLLGHGLSSTPNKAKHYLFESLVQDLVAVFDHFTNESRISIIIGHGYGACMGTVLSRIRSQNISLLISISGGGPTPLIPFGCLEKPLLPFRLNLFGKSRKKPIGRFDNPDLEHILPPAIHDHILKGQLWIDGDAAFHRRITVPTLLVYGMRDTVVSLIEECEMERTIPKAFLELLPTAGHMVMWDDPKTFNRMLMKFIQAWT